MRGLFLKNMHIGLVAILVGGLLGVLLVWLFLVYRGIHFVRIVPYSVSMPSKPGAQGRVYSLGKEKYLLVLADESSRHYEAYYVDLEHRRIGIPSFDFSRYAPFSRGAWVDEQSLEGYPFEGELTGNWFISADEIRVRITGFSDGARKSGLLSDPEKLSRQWMPIAYETEIALSTRKRVAVHENSGR